MPKGMRTTHTDMAVNTDAPTKEEVEVFIEETKTPPGGKPIMMKIKAVKPYCNYAIANGKGDQWKIGEVREVSWSEYTQMMSDDYTAFERIE